MAKPKRRIIPVFIPNTGCIHQCVFCDQRLITGQCIPVTAGDVRRACGILLSGAQNSEISGEPVEIAFYGGSFTAIPISKQEELLQAAREFIEHSAHNSIRISTRPDCIDKETVSRMRSFGVTTIELGAQSMCDDVLALSKRGHTSHDVTLAASIIKEAGLSLILQMMTGLPGDTRDKSVRTAKEIIEMEPDGVRVYPTVVVRGTELHRMWLRGQYREHSVEEAVGLCVELCELFSKAGIPVIRLGLNPSDGLSAGDAAAGAYDPAFGELVYSQIYYNKAEALLEGTPSGSSVTITVPKGRVSMMAGQRRRNICALAEKFSLKSIKIVETDINTTEIKIEMSP